MGGHYSGRRQGQATVEGSTDRMCARSRKLFAELGAHYVGHCGRLWPPKQKGMHRRRYEAICAQLTLEATGLDRELSRAFRRLARTRGNRASLADTGT
jgi:hypothetical protein